MKSESTIGRTAAQWATDALSHIQSACNLSGLVYAFERCIEDLHAIEADEALLNHHPICVMWSDKMDDLSGSRDFAPIKTREPLRTLMPQFTAAMRDVCAEALQLGHGSEWRNQHPSVQKHVRRIVYVTGSREPGNLLNAITACRHLTDRR